MKFDFQRMRESVRDTFQRGVQPSSGGPGGSFNFLEQVRELTSAIQLLTIVPIPGSRQLFAMQDDTSSHVITGSGYFSLVGFLIGLITCLIPFLFNALPSFVLSALAIIVLVILTGGIHLDGLIDTCDGVFGRLDRASKLEIMRDSRVGSFGLLGAACMLLLKFALLGSLSVNLFFPALLIAPAISRWCVVL